MAPENATDPCDPPHTALYNSPKKLQRIPHWMGTRVERKPNGQLNKPPYRVRDGMQVIKAAKTNSDNWATFKEARDALERGDVDAIGFVFTEDDPFPVFDFDGARRSAVKARTRAANQLHALVSTAPERLKASLRGFATKQLAQKASRFRCGAESANPTAVTKFALRSVARRYEVLSAEIAELDAHIERLAREAAPELIALDGVGPDTAATLLVAAGDNPERLKSEASFAHLCGAAPVAASSGKTVRHRLKLGGNRDANRALHVVALNRLRRDPRTQQYVARRTAEGKSKKEAVRCLKRYIARESYRMILLDTGARVPPD
jgi:transposase